jgi:hypothetical protein
MHLSRPAAGIQASDTAQGHPGLPLGRVAAAQDEPPASDHHDVGVVEVEALADLGEIDGVGGL